MPLDNENRLLSHDKQLVKIDTILERVANNQDHITNNVSNIATTIATMAATEKNIKESFDRVHTRIDEEVLIRDTKIEDIHASLKTLEVFSFLSTYPKITIFVCCLLYAVAISDVRTAVKNNLSTPDTMIMKALK